jgi:outer membrane autotransporter protein
MVKISSLPKSKRKEELELSKMNYCRSRILSLAVLTTLLAGGTAYAATTTNLITTSNTAADPYSSIEITQAAAGATDAIMNGVKSARNSQFDLYLTNGALLSVTNDGSKEKLMATRGILCDALSNVDVHGAANIVVRADCANNSTNALATNGVIGYVGSISLSDNTSLTVISNDLRTANQRNDDNTNGIGVAGSNITGKLGNNFSVDVKSDVENGNKNLSSKGLIASYSTLTAGDNTNISVSVTNNTAGTTVLQGLCAMSSAKVAFGKNTAITINNNSNNSSNVSKTQAVDASGASNVTFGGLAVKMNITSPDDSYRPNVAALNAKDSSIINVNQGSNNDVQLEGDVISSKGTINADLNTASSFLKGNTKLDASGGDINLNLSNGATWYPIFDNRFGDLNDSETSFKLVSATTDTVTEQGNITLKDAVVDMTWDKPTRSGDYRTLTFDKVSGSNDIFKINTDLANNKGDEFVLGAGSALTSAKVDVKYDPYLTNTTLFTGTKLKGNAVVFAGDGVANLKNVTGMEDTYNTYDYTPTITQNSDGTWSVTALTINKSEGSSRAVRMAGENGLSLNQLWLAEANNMHERMGELRGTKPAKAGIWARWHNGKIEQDDTSTQYNIFQGGVDKESNGTHERTYRGFAVSHGTGSSDLELGSGDLSETTLSLYQTGIRNNGFYYDVIAKAGKYANDYDLTESANKSSGEYSTWSYGISGEVGQRKDLGHGVYVEPQAELMLGHINSADYTTNTGMDVSLDAQNRVVTRLGAQIGKEFKGGDIYARASYYHDFGSGLNIDCAAGGATSSYSPDLIRNWGALCLGGNVKAGKNCNVYGEVSKYVGQLSGRPSVNLGVRWAF